MKYISSSCIKGEKKISEVLKKISQFGFSNIELSGGTQYEENITDILLEAKSKLNLNLLCHNYFPSPKVPFVANLASLDSDIHKFTMSHFKKSIDLSYAIGAKKFGLHAGFYTDIFLSQIGGDICKKPLYNKNKAFVKFCKSFDKLKSYSNGRVDLYIENNVLAKHNYLNYDKNNLFMLTNLDEYDELKKNIDFTILLDVAHLYVSSKTLGRGFENEATVLWDETDYIHVSDNDGIKDLNLGLKKDGEILSVINSCDKKNKTFTFEVYQTLEEIRKSTLLFDFET